MSYPAAGDLNRRITIQRRQAGQDGYGQRLAGWDNVITCWAAITPLSGRELITAQAVQAETTHEITIRHRPGIVAAMRVLYGARRFDVHSVIDPDTSHHTLTLLCSEGLIQFPAAPAQWADTDTWVDTRIWADS